MTPKNFKNDVDSAILAVWHISTLEDILEICALKQTFKNQTEQLNYHKISLNDASRVSDRDKSAQNNKRYLSLFNAAGIRSVEELSRFSPENLFANLLDINLELKILPQLPSLSQIYDWIRQAIVFQEVLAY